MLANRALILIVGLSALFLPHIDAWLSIKPVLRQPAQLSPRQQAEVAFERATELLESGDVDEAIDCYSRAIEELRSYRSESDSNDVEAFGVLVRLRRGEAFAVQGRHVAARDDFGGVIDCIKARDAEPEIGPMHGLLAAALDNRGHLAVNEGNAVDAIEDFDKAIVVYRLVASKNQGTSGSIRLANCLVARARLHLLQGNVELALSDTAQAAEVLNSSKSLKTDVEYLFVLAVVHETRARTLVAQQRLAEAYTEFTEAIQGFRALKVEIKSSSAEVSLAVCLQFRGDVLFALERFDEACADYNEAIAACKAASSAERDVVVIHAVASCHSALGRIRLMEGESEKALQDLSVAVETHRQLGLNDGENSHGVELTTCLFHRATALQRLNRIEEALDDFTAVIDALLSQVGSPQEELQSKDMLTSARFTRALILLAQGNSSESLLDLDFVVKSNGDPVNKDAASSCYSLAVALCTRGNALLFEGRFSDAQADFVSTITQLEKVGNDETATQETDSVRAQAKCGLARSLILQKNNRDALDALGEAIGALKRLKDVATADSANGALAAALCERGNVWLELGKDDRAKEDFDAVVEESTGTSLRKDHTLAQSLVLARHGRGAILDRQGKLSPAIAEYNEAVKISRELIHGKEQPSNELLSRGLTFRASVLAQIGKLRDAQRDLNEAVSLLERRHGERSKDAGNLQLAAACSDLAWLYATASDDELRDGKKAKNLSMRSMELAGGEHRHRFVSAAALAEARNFTAAISMLNLALAVCPDSFKENYQSFLELYESKKPYRIPRVELRGWSDAEGKYWADAEFVDMENGAVKLRNPMGEIVIKPIRELSAADQLFLASLCETGQESVLIAISEFGGVTFLRDETCPGRPIISVRLTSKLMDDSDLEIVGGLPFLRNLVLRNTSVTDNGLSQLTNLPRLQALHVFDASIDNAALVHVAKIASLREVTLRRTFVDADGQKWLREVRPGLKVTVSR